MRRLILLGVLALFSCVTAVLVVAVGVGELLSGAAPTAVNTLSTDFPVEPVQIPVSAHSRKENSSVHGWLAQGVRGGGAVLLVHSIRSPGKILRR